jgi:cytochrome oxidase Cu insertion factor (SCO1/SenC/PrrC family)
LPEFGGKVVKVLTVLLQITVLTLIAASANADPPINIQRNTPVAIGDTAPDFTLEDESGNKVTLSAARDKSPVVLVFYRGYW